MNIPEVKLGIVAVSRDCFPIALSTQRRKNIVAAFGEGIYECPITVENEKDALAALADVNANGVNALVVFLGNFGPEGPETMLAEKFGALAEEISILYGGSCKPSNAKELFACPDIDGGLIGGAALKAEDFIGIAVSF